ncbi:MULTISPECIES: MFS transporter [Brevibacillus]|jgi:MFS family permease|uniref:Major facilitator superfamily protein n=1 Tax=Brevibacillus borstelensis AK1 TaxID=1300222 RepID=M8D8N3_9BACL|nr:MFS transporter [Brevibacillus borstelensis]EMT52604.1 major facilitator superfamily protein [Brevibacillus borstelensis AK1]KKX55115.1 MFS transporter [Brevibacillus borstelensis cifa_chp40]MBE5396924.1 MFS transporter [Brevibacillus borstelensis]MCC0563833.1 MFS transporter [Brevibacillus borstelensis]MCM3472048.1 MFS transporter [Brevibacillus borstelensis]
MAQAQLSNKPWYKEVTQNQWRALIAAGSGWALDAMDVMLYSMVLVQVMQELQMDKTAGGFLATLTLLSSAFGGLLFGMVADRYGRTKSLMISIIVYSLFTFLCGFSQTVTQLAVFRLLLGLGMGGEWVAGAALITETWDAKHRGKAMGLVQSAWAIGYALAAIVAGLVIPLWGWRGVFFFGIVPALVAIWIRKGTKEPEIWEKMKQEATTQKKKSKPKLVELFSGKVLRWTILGAALSVCAQFGYWGLFTWIPSYLGTPVDQGGAGLDIMKSTTWIVIMQAGAWLGYVSFGFLADKIGRKKTFILFFALAALLVPFYGMSSDATRLLILGPFVAFFGSGYFSGFGAVLAELFPTEIRATGQGFCYNFGRGIAATAPTVVGFMATGMGLGAAFGFLAISFALAAILVLLFLPETMGKQLN